MPCWISHKKHPILKACDMTTTKVFFVNSSTEEYSTLQRKQFHSKHWHFKNIHSSSHVDFFKLPSQRITSFIGGFIVLRVRTGTKFRCPFRCPLPQRKRLRRIHPSRAQSCVHIWARKAKRRRAHTQTTTGYDQHSEPPPTNPCNTTAIRVTHV